MKELNNNNKQLIIISIVSISILLCIGGFLLLKVFFSSRDSEDVREEPITKNVDAKEVSNYDVKLIKEINNTATGNYLISPYSIEVVLSMLRDGADGSSKEQIDSLIGKRTINNNLNVKGKLEIANGMFIKNVYKDKVLDSYYKNSIDKYNSEIIYDDFKSPKLINDWVNNKTNGMIPKVFNSLSPNFAMALANAVAIDMAWKYKFDCHATVPKEFTRLDGTKKNVAMMHTTKSNGARVFYGDNAKGLMIPYQAYNANGKSVKEGGRSLEFVAIMPNTDIKTYMNNLTVEDLKQTEEEGPLKSYIEIYLPKFEYDYSIDDLSGILKNLGVKDIFDNNANFSKMIDAPVYVNSIVHKTYISVDENGTKAAAATSADINVKSVIEEDDRITFTFDEPFAYLIRDRETNEILFFGVVNDPPEWSEDNTCK